MKVHLENQIRVKVLIDIEYNNELRGKYLPLDILKNQAILPFRNFPQIATELG